MSGFWSFFIIALTVLNLVAAVWLLMATSKSKGLPQGETVETTGHTWDGDLQEFNNPLPRWWLWLFYLTIVFAVIYLILYPGLGNFAGVLGWSQTCLLYTSDAADDSVYV